MLSNSVPKFILLLYSPVLGKSRLDYSFASSRQSRLVDKEVHDGVDDAHDDTRKDGAPDIHFDARE